MMSVTLHTSMGDIKLELECSRVPRASENFLALCARGDYNNTVFHRVLPGYCVQGGDPTGTGKQSNSVWGKGVADEIVTGLADTRFSAPGGGVVAFANKGEPSPTGVGSQFFITSAPCRHLAGTCTVFGSVIWGMETVTAMSNVEVDEHFRPTTELRLEKVTIHANPIAEAAG